MSSSRENNAYILGTDTEELQRLGLQHQVWASEAQQGWHHAGYTKGKTILDLGSGPGFCTREIATIVGKTGKVLAVDKSQKYLDYINKINESQRLNIETIHTEFDNMDLAADSIDGMYCRWALAWIPNPKEVLAKVHAALKPQSKIVIHEYYHWMSHQINPSHPLVDKAIAQCYQSFQDAPGNIDIGKELPTMLEELGYTITLTRPMSKLAQPTDLAWQWPRSFYEVYWPKIKEMGYLTEEELNAALSKVKEYDSRTDITLLCPLLIEVVAEKN